MPSLVSVESGLARRRRGEAGYTTVFTMASFFTLFLFFALVANVGQAVNRRVMLQMAADAGAFTGASVQSSGLNMISYYNGLIHKAWQWTERLMLYFTIQFCGVDDVITRAYNIAQAALSVTIQVVNHGGAAWAVMEAESVTRDNLKQLFPDGSAHTALQSVGRALANPRSIWGTAKNVFYMRRAWKPLFSELSLVRLEEDSVFKVWICYRPKAHFRLKFGSFDRWYTKEEDSEITRFYWWVTADEVPALVLPELFGTVPPMTAVALAKPIGGDLAPKGNGPRYLAKLIPVRTVGIFGSLRHIQH
ncbi:MAG: pilus assembly protein TadG-related protein [Vicinamibacteria bacterium]